VAHLTTKEELTLIDPADSNITAEVCIPHLVFTDADYATLGTRIKCNPAVKDASHRIALRSALTNGKIATVATDHAPHTAEDKASGSPGFSGLETAFAVCYTNLCIANGMSLKKLSEKMSARPAEILELNDCGLLQEGMLANLTVVDTEKTWTVRGEEFASKGKYTPFEGKKLIGEIQATFYRGKIVFQA
jgi:dihydroorotase